MMRCTNDKQDERLYYSFGFVKVGSRVEMYNPVTTTLQIYYYPYIEDIVNNLFISDLIILNIDSFI